MRKTKYIISNYRIFQLNCKLEYKTLIYPVEVPASEKKNRKKFSECLTLEKVPKKD